MNLGVRKLFIIHLFRKDIFKFLTFINSSVPNVHFRFPFLWEFQQQLLLESLGEEKPT